MVFQFSDYFSSHIDLQIMTKDQNAKLNETLLKEFPYTIHLRVLVVSACTYFASPVPCAVANIVPTARLPMGNPLVWMSDFYTRLTRNPERRLFASACPRRSTTASANASDSSTHRKSVPWRRRPTRKLTLSITRSAARLPSAPRTLDPDWSLQPDLT